MTDGHASDGETPREELSRRLKALFVEAGMSTHRIAAQLNERGIEASQPKVSRTLNGVTAATPEFVGQLLDLLTGVPADERAELLALTGEVRAGNRRLVLSRDLAALQRRMGRYYRKARLIRGFLPAGLPGLLTSEPYARQVMGEERATTQRIRNQAILDEPGREFRWVLAAGALGFPALLSPTGMADELDNLVEMSRRPSIHVGVIPWGRPCPDLPVHGYELFDDQTMVTGGETYGLDLDTDADAAAYVALTDRLEQAACWGDEARALIRSAADRYRSL